MLKGTKVQRQLLKIMMIPFLIISKAQLKNRPALESTFNSSRNYQHQLINSVTQGQSIQFTGQRMK
ncbi:unnamed protein product [Paramecium pentaurelia]|uniref:Uncharacterized protein n=1 Tax=Paramecium pentaurelia TaxID=43138 RepID=A0A8S1W4Y2_9CILI|nr:unnamed protein product [Paramecium pentaurelia]